jgi:hypothetical protein
MSNVDLETLLDTDLSQVADLPEFYTPENGVYLATIDSIVTSTKTNKSGEYVDATIKYLLHANLDEAGEPVPDNAMNTESYNLSNAEFGLPKFKKITSAIAAALGTTNLRAVIEGAAGMQVVITVKNRKDKADKDRVYFSVAELALAN